MFKRKLFVNLANVSVNVRDIAAVAKENREIKILLRNCQGSPICINYNDEMIKYIDDHWDRLLKALSEI